MESQEGIPVEQMISESVGRSKKVKQMERREAFMQSAKHTIITSSFVLTSLSLLELEPSTRHFSKSHERRMKRKAQEQLAGNMDDLQTALASLDEEIALPESIEKLSSSIPKHSEEVKPKASSSIGKIGKGNSSTLSKAQRQRQL